MLLFAYRVMLGCLVVLFTSVSAKAQVETMAESLFRQARSELKIGNTERACILFSESYRLDPTRGTLFNLASCEEQRGKTATAWTLFRKLLDVMPADDARAPLARQRIEQLEPKLPKLHVDLAPGISENISVELDGIALSRLVIGTALPVDPGTHVITLRYEGVSLRTYTVETRIAEITSQRIEIGADLEVSKPAKQVVIESPRPVRSKTSRLLPTSPGPSKSLRNGAFVAAGTGGAALIASGVFALLAIRERDEMRDACNQIGCHQRGLDAAQRGDNYVSLANIGLVLGAVGLTTGGMLLWQSAKQSARVQLTTASVMLTGSLP
jgi:hypothetical protein